MIWLKNGKIFAKRDPSDRYVIRINSEKDLDKMKMKPVITQK